MTLLLDKMSGAELSLTIAVAVVGGLVAIGLLFALIARIVLLSKYSRFNKQETQAGYTAYAAARALLDANEMKEVEVKQAGFFRAWFIGNSYSIPKKTIFLRKNIINKKSVTAVGLAMQKVGLALQDKQGDKKLKARSFMLPFTFFAPNLFIPIVLVGFIADLLLGFSWIPSIIGIIIASAFYLFAFLFLLLNIPVEKKACAQAMEILEKSNLMNEDERQDIKSLYNTYIWMYVIDFVVALLRLVQMILKIFLKLAKKK